ncbi:MAG: hypothetical protein U0903_08030 [Planctomycetales bacterium]
MARTRTQRSQFSLRRTLRPPLLSRTILGILLGTIPLLGAWSAGKWLIPWAESVDVTGGLKGATQAVWAFGAVLGSRTGRLVGEPLWPQADLLCNQCRIAGVELRPVLVVDPSHPAFLPVAFLLGFVATIYFGWLPLYLPELFPTKVRATGSGISYNVGRFASAAGVFAAGGLMATFHGDYAQVGMITSLIYALGMVVICFAPDIRALQD